MNLYVKTLKALKDNYIFILCFAEQAIVIDPGACQGVLEFLKKQNLHVSHILNTHHHSDHTGANKQLKEIFDCKILGPKEIENCDEIIIDGQSFSTGILSWKAIHTPGHTLGHICYYLEQEKMLFSGDTLFSGGCGRLFEADANTMFKSLQKLYHLPDDVLVYCAHEYTLQNLKFAASLEKENVLVQKALKQAIEAQQKQIPTIPSSIAREKCINPFFKLCAKASAKNLREFTSLREQKDVF